MGRWRTVLLSRAFQVPAIVMVILVVGSALYYRSAVARSETAVNERSLRVLAALAEELSNRIATLEKLGHPEWNGADLKDLRDLVPSLEREECPDLWPAEDLDPQRRIKFFRYKLHILVGTSKLTTTPAVQQHRRGLAQHILVGTSKLTTTRSCWSISIESLMSSFEDSLPKGVFEDLLLADSSGRIRYQTLRSGMKIADLHPFFEEAEHREDKAGERLEKALASVVDKTGKHGDDKTGKEGKNKTGKKEKNPPPAANPPSAANETGNPEPESEEKVQELAARLATSSLRNVDLGGEPYKLYTVPVPVPVLMDDASPPLFFIVGGILRAGAFNAERSTPLANSVVTIGFFLLLGAVGTYPILKFKLMRPDYVLTWWTGLAFVLPMVFAAILVGGLAGHMMFSHYEEQTNAELQRLANRIEHNLADETWDALTMLSNLETFHGKTAAADQSVYQPCSEQETQPDFHHHGGWFPNILQQFPNAVYPYFDHAYFADNAGNQKIKFSAREFITPEVPVCGSAEFRHGLREAVSQQQKPTLDVRLGDLWQFRDHPDDRRPFWIEPMYSPTSGRYLAMIGRPSAKELANTLPVAVIGTTWVSVSQPVFPPDYGFAVVDRGGKVLFHSTPAKNGRENFADACDHGPRLHDLFEMRESGILDTLYLGIRHRVLVQPIGEFEHCPWSIVVFRDRTSWDDDHLDSVLLFCFLSIGYFILLIVAGWLAGSAKRPTGAKTENHQYLRWIWPTETNRPVYGGIFWGLVIVIFLNSVLFSHCDGTQLWVTACTIPLAAVAIVVLKLRSKNWIIVGLSSTLWLIVILGTALHNRPVWPFRILFTCICVTFACLALPLDKLSVKIPRLANVYALLATALLFNIGFLPALRLFNASVLFQEVVAARRSQLELADQLEQRQQRIINAYSGTYGDEEPARGRFLIRRLDQETKDRYYLDPPVPTSLTATPVSSRRISLKWSAATDGIPPDEYHIFRGATPSTLKPLGDSTTTSYLDGRVAASATYYYAVQAVDKSGHFSRLSARVFATTLALPSASTNLAATPAAPPPAPAPTQNLQPNRLEPLLSLISSSVLERDGNSPRHRSGWGSRDSLWEWCEQGEFPETKKLILLKTAGLEAGEGNRQEIPCSGYNGDTAAGYPNTSITSTLPQGALVDPGATGWAFLMLATAAAAFFPLRYVIKSLFVLDWKPPEKRWPEIAILPNMDLKGPPFESHAILLGAPFSGKTEALKHRSDVHYIDLMAEPQSWTEHAAPKADGVVVLDHFEHFLDSSAQRKQELLVLEWLVYEIKCRVVIVTTVDPQYYFDCMAARQVYSGKAGDGTLDIERWTKVLASFHIVQAKNPSSIEGDKFCALLWQTCSDEECLTLYQIAKHGWANYHQGPALTHLFQRGLIVQDRNFEVRDQDFAGNIRNSFKVDHLAIPTEAGAADNLNALRAVLFVVAVVFFAALAYVSGDQVMSYVVTGAGAVTPAIRAFASSKGSGPGSANLA
jgi:hypothetical protein